ncbi:hypothetical protein ABM016_15515 [Morganella morganii]|uniref:hypothetical protein n=1 Tax=Morganella morganii TaxID=582 RepID=UPI003EC0E4A8
MESVGFFVSFGIRMFTPSERSSTVILKPFFLYSNSVTGAAKATTGVSVSIAAVSRVIFIQNPLQSSDIMSSGKKLAQCDGRGISGIDAIRAYHPVWLKNKKTPR